MPRVAINGTELEYLEQGTDQPVVFVHGDLSDCRTWTHQMDAPAHRYRVVAYSRRYARPNEDIPDGVDDQMMPHVDDLVALIQTLDMAPAHIIGSSWGAFIGLLLARRHPDLTKTLVLSEPPALPLLGLGSG